MSTLRTEELALLGIDLEGTLREDPRFLLDAPFLGVLHAELDERLASDEGRAALLQLGALHGLRDSSRLVRAGFAGDNALSTHGPSAPRLVIHATPRWGGAKQFELHGAWPERREARAVGARLGEVGHPRCFVSTGYTSGWLTGVYDTPLVAVEEQCFAAGDGACRFRVREARAWEPGSAGASVAAALPLEVLREVVSRHLEPDRESAPTPEETDRYEPGAPVVHVWGPVMVVPFLGPDESLRALELIGRDPGARHVRVVVVDLSGAFIDAGFGAAALEQILDAVEGWGAEPLLTGVSPLSEPVVAELGRSHLVLQKALPDAIAVGFQIAHAQRRLL